jgi:cytochrome c553
MKMMKISALLLVAGAGLCMAQTPAKMGEIYKHRCANCHGEKADGVSMLKEMPGVKSETAAMRGTTSQEQPNIHGPALKHLSLETLQAKLIDFRSKGFDVQSVHSVMRNNLKTIEEREGDIDDAAMAAYIYNTFGEGAE